MYLNETEWERIEELASDQHVVNTICRGHIINRVMPMYFESFFRHPMLVVPFAVRHEREGLDSTKWTCLMQAREWGNYDKVCQASSDQREE